MFPESSLLRDRDVRTKWKQEVAMARILHQCPDARLAQDLAGGFALVLLLVAGLHLPLLV
jgi:hypothetical protein